MRRPARRAGSKLRTNAVDRTPPIRPFDAPQAAKQVVRNFKTGAICPAEMWKQLADVMSPDDAGEILDALPLELQSELRASYRERPLSFWALRGNPLRRHIKSWCQRSAAPPG